MDVKYDLVVVGTGFASSFFLKKYLEKSPAHVRVLVLERGILFPHQSRLQHKKGMDVALTAHLENPYATYKNENSDKDWVFDPNFGGSSNCWTACTPRFMPNDFKLKTLYGIGADWPITYADLNSYYDEAEELMLVGGPLLTPFPKKSRYPLPPQVLSAVDTILHQQYQELYISQPTARATVATRNRGACCSSAVCNLCPVNAKFTIENGLSSLYSDPRVTLVYNAKVYTLDVQNDVVQSVVYEKDGREHKASGEAVVLGANGIFNPHILLNAGDTNRKTGAGLCEQAGTYGYIYLKDLDNVGGSSIITANGFMMYDTADRGNYAGCLIESFNDPFIRNEAGRWRHIAKFKYVFEDLPDENSKVMLSNDRLVPKLFFNGRSAYTLRAMEALRGNIEKYFSVLPIEKVVLDGYFQDTEYHICSTTRMSHRKEDGVIDAQMIHHQFRNLFVLGSSAFPTVTPANPTLTLSALSLRAADLHF